MLITFRNSVILNKKFINLFNTSTQMYCSVIIYLAAVVYPPVEL